MGWEKIAANMKPRCAICPPLACAHGVSNGWPDLLASVTQSAAYGLPLFILRAIFRAETLLRFGRERGRLGTYSSFSGSSAMFFSPAAFFSQYLRTQASQLLPAAMSRPLNTSAAISE